MSVSLLATDGYKFSMAEAGWPLRKETFYFAFRRGGAVIVAFDVEAFVRALRPRVDAAADAEREYLTAHEYALTDASRAAFTNGELVVRAAPKGTWVLPHEPIATITGPSALVSFMEPLLLQTHYRFQLATLALRDRAALERAVETLTCGAQRAIVLETLDAVGAARPAMRVDEDAYAKRVGDRAREIAEAAGDGSRIFEVGLRAASCMEQHLIALRACKEAGVTRTSNVLGAKKLSMTPVGTMGHEHVQRFGSDEAAFRAMKERRPARSSFLLDTFDTLRSGLPAAFEIIAEDPHARDSIRYDSGDKEAQYLVAVEKARALGVRPVHVIEDGLGASDVKRFEALREKTGVKPDEQFYGSGGWLVSQTEGSGLTRDKVAAVYKLSRTGKRAVMKLSNDAGKVSVPGVPVVWRRVSGEGPAGIVAQEDEKVRDGYVRLDQSSAPASMGAPPTAPTDDRVEMSDATRTLADDAKRAAFASFERPT